MATAKKTVKAPTQAVAKKTPAVKASAPAKKAAAPVKAVKAVKAVKTPAAKTPAAKVPAAKTAAAKAPAAKKAVVAKAAAPLKPIKSAFTKAGLIAHLAEYTGVEPKATKAVLSALEETIVASLSKKGAGAFTLPGLLKIDVQKVAAKKKRFGKDPFTGQERWFDAKPATVRVKARALKKLKDAAA